jgi:hypothetical protein
MSTRTGSGNEFPVFVRWQDGTGTVFIDSAGQKRYFSKEKFIDIYGDKKYSSYILPIMMTMRHVMGNEAWHRDTDFANLTIDDPVLVEPFFQLSYFDLLREMEAHNFHTTISLIPARWETYDKEVVTLFLKYPERYSIAQHGNNADGYEFYKYEVSEEELANQPDLIARPLEEQEADIRQGMGRMHDMYVTLRLPCDPVMVFPSGIAPEQTLEVLKGFNYLGTVNAQPVPLGETIPDLWDYGMHPAEMQFGNFALLTRRHPGSYSPFKAEIQPFLFDLFIDKPALFYSHAYEDELFAESVDAFNIVADQVNELPTYIEWKRLGYILSHLYLEKQNDDSSISVRMFTNKLIITNQSEDQRIYHIQKQESLNVAISSVTVNGEPYPYKVQEGLFVIDLKVPANSTIEIAIEYGG